MERETGIEPAISSLGSWRQAPVLRRTKHSERGIQGRMWHWRHLLNTLLSTTFLVVGLPLIPARLSKSRSTSLDSLV